MDPIKGCRRAVDEARALVSSVRPDELATPTPCAAWDVRALIGHMAGVNVAFAGVLRGGQIDLSVAQGKASFGGDDPVAAYRATADDAMREWEAPGALEKTLELPFGPTPAAFAIRIFTADQLVHAWDLAKALGRPHQMDEDLAAQTLEMMQGILKPEMRGPEAGFDQAQPVSDDATIQDRLLAFSGRRP